MVGKDLLYIQSIFNNIYNFEKIAEHSETQLKEEILGLSKGENWKIKYFKTVLVFDSDKEPEFQVLFDIFKNSNASVWDYRVKVIYNKKGGLKNILVID